MLLNGSCGLWKTGEDWGKWWVCFHELFAVENFGGAALDDERIFLRLPVL